MSATTAIVAFVLGLVAAIMLHEAGHFLTAKRFGMRADRFFLGFGPTVWSTRRGETEYGVKALWLGGFVRIRGMSDLDERRRSVADDVFDPASVAEDHDHLPVGVGAGGATGATGVPSRTWERLETELLERGTPRGTAGRIVRRTRENAAGGGPAAGRRALEDVLTEELPPSERPGDLTHRLLQGDRDRFFSDKPAWQRAIVLVAGSAVHFLIAIAVLLIAFLFIPSQFVGLTPEVDDVLADSPAEAGGLEVGDRILAVEGVVSDDYERLRDVIQGRAGQATELTVARDGAELDLVVTPAPVEDPETGDTVGQVGFAPTVLVERLPAGDALRAATTGEIGFLAQFRGTFAAIGQVFGPEGLGVLASQATGETERTPETGAVSIVGAAGLAGQVDLFGLLLLTASLNVFIGIFNLLPLPPLDGGHLAVLGIERSVNLVRGARGKPTDFTVDPRAVAAVAVPTLAVLLFVFVALLYLDITSPLQL
jgi:regulator of sigma E protease